MKQSENIPFPVEASCMCLYSYVTTGYINGADHSKTLEAVFEDLSLTDAEELLHDTGPLPIVVTARDVVLRRCGQTAPIPFEQCYPNT